MGAIYEFEGKILSINTADLSRHSAFQYMDKAHKLHMAIAEYSNFIEQYLDIQASSKATREGVKGIAEDRRRAREDANTLDS